MAYEKQNWETLPATTTPITGSRLNHMEDGISNTYDDFVLTSEDQSIDGQKIFLQPVTIKGRPTQPDHSLRLEDLDKRTEYSTTEEIIGKWINGKNIYRKVVIISSLPSSPSNEGYDHNIDDIEFVTSITGILTSSSDHYFPVPSIRPVYPDYSIGLWADKKQIFVEVSNDRSTAKLYAIIEYTKTTD